MPVTRRFPFTPLLLGLSLVLISACGKGDKREGDNTEAAAPMDRFLIAVDGGEPLTFNDSPASPASDSPDAPRPLLAGGVEVGKDGESTAILWFDLAEDDEQQAMRFFYISFSAFSVGEHDRSKAYAYFYHNGTYLNGEDYVAEGDLPLTVNVDSYDEVTGKVRGDYDITLCRLEAYDANTCTIVDNRVRLTGSFDVTVDTRPVESVSAQGTAAAPVDLGKVPLNWPEHDTTGTVDTGSSFYRIPVHEGSYYEVRLNSFESENTIDFRIFGDTDFSLELCRSEDTYLQDSCSVTAAGETLYMRVDYTGSGVGTRFGISIEDYTAYPNESGVDLGATLPIAYEGSTGHEQSTYQVSVSPGKTYTVRLEQPTTKELEFNVFDGEAPAGSSPLCHSTWEEFECSTLASSNALTIVTKVYFMQNGARYTLVIEEGGTSFTSEGSLEGPIALGPGLPLTHEGQVGITESVYSVSLIPGEAYALTMTEVSDDGVAVTIYDGEAHSSPRLARCTGTRPCPFLAGQNDAATLVVEGSGTTSGAAYTLRLKQGEADSAYPSEDLSFTGATFPLSHVGSVGFQASFYNVEVIPGRVHKVTVDSQKKGTDFTVRKTDSFYPDATLCNGGFVTRNRTVCTFIPETETVGIVVTNNGWDNYDGGTPYTLTIEQDDGATVYTDQGTYIERFALGNAPVTFADASVGPTGSHYRVQVSPNSHYVLRLSELTAGVYAQVDLAYTMNSDVVTCNNWPIGIADRECDIKTSASTTSIGIDVIPSYSISGASFKLTLEEAPAGSN